MVLERQSKRRFQKGVYLLPSIFTVANMFCGWACVVYAMRGDYIIAAPLIAFAMILEDALYTQISSEVCAKSI